MGGFRRILKNPFCAPIFESLQHILSLKSALREAAARFAHGLQ